MSNKITGLVAVFLATLGETGLAMFKNDKEQSYVLYNGTNNGNHLLAGPDAIGKVPEDSEPGKALAELKLNVGDRITFDEVGEILKPTVTQTAPAPARKAGCANRAEMHGRYAEE